MRFGETVRFATLFIIGLGQVIVGGFAPDEARANACSQYRFQRHYLAAELHERAHAERAAREAADEDEAKTDEADAAAAEDAEDAAATTAKTACARAAADAEPTAAAVTAFRAAGKVVCARCDLKTSQTCRSMFRASDTRTVYSLCGEGVSDQLISLTRHGELEVIVHGHVRPGADGEEVLCVDGFSVGNI